MGCAMAGHPSGKDNYSLYVGQNNGGKVHNPELNVLFLGDGDKHSLVQFFSNNSDGHRVRIRCFTASTTEELSSTLNLREFRPRESLLGTAVVYTFDFSSSDSLKSLSSWKESLQGLASSEDPYIEFLAGTLEDGKLAEVTEDQAKEFAGGNGMSYCRIDFDDFESLITQFVVVTIGRRSKTLSLSVYDYMFKLVLVGNSGVGKTSLIQRLTDNTYVEQASPTLGVDFKLHTISIGHTIVKLQIWDTAGQERFAGISSSYFRGAHGILFVYDISDPSSFENLAKWLEMAVRPSCVNCMLAVGNKCDMRGETTAALVDPERGREWAESVGMDWIETSAKNGVGVEEMVLRLVTAIIKKLEE